MKKLEEALLHIDTASAMIVTSHKPSDIFDQLHKATAILESLISAETKNN